jgi:hypothetical protein
MMYEERTWGGCDEERVDGALLLDEKHFQLGLQVAREEIQCLIR